ncbi:hypothetical protein [Salmonella enterica]|uniref:hypothetical protein n=1 Tax=Salmonella enterica TaxID=28901 RepID=UPI001CF1DA0C
MAAIDFIPDRLNVRPVVWRGFTVGEQVSTGEGRGFSYLLLTLVKVNNRKDRIF